ncbi:hypothetical protein BS17DRAFT_519584 [Gyrodon lividus]|nr:hypothetical protein BS17DRAFT_519584 [Gyrodon lividus]
MFTFACSRMTTIFYFSVFLLYLAAESGATSRTFSSNRNFMGTTSMLTDASKYDHNATSTTGKRLRLVRRRGNELGTPTKRQNDQPTPEPTGDSSASTTVYISGPNSFALLLPGRDDELVSDAENDAVAYCTSGSGCTNPFPSGFITGSAVAEAADGSYMQITGCLDSSQFRFAQGDDGGQFDVRFPNGAQCTFGGYGASFIEQVEPSANRFCLRCCKNADDQQNCNSHQDRAGCPVAIPGTYEFGEVGCS